jgi:uncharacterized membrane protein YkoI
MKPNRVLIVGLMAGSLAVAGFATPSRTKATPKSDVPAELAKQAKISLVDARATALAQVPGGKVKSEELEREHGKLIYSFDIEVAGKSGIEEVNVNAVDGKIVAKKHESARREAQEKRQEKPDRR